MNELIIYIIDFIYFFLLSTDTLDPTGKFSSGKFVGAPRDGMPQDQNDAATDTIPVRCYTACRTVCAAFMSHLWWLYR